MGHRQYGSMLAIALVLGVLVATPLSSWIMSAVWPGSGTRNAYEVFGQLNWTRRDAPPLDAMARAELQMIDERLATLLAGRPRLHPPGTLATLEYTAVGANGEELDRWQVRAITPAPDDIEHPDAEVWKADVPDIESRLKQEGGMILRRSGETGLPPEAVLRLRVGESTEIAPPDDFFTNDFLDGTSHRLRQPAPATALGAGTANVVLRVRLVEACAADVRVGQITRMEFAPFAPVPIPTGFRTLRWVQMTGCTPRAITSTSTTNTSAPIPRISEGAGAGLPQRAP
jgi:hypothetical protein